MTTVTKTVYATWDGGKESEGKDGPGSHRYVSLELILRYKRTRLTLCIEYSYWQYKEINLEMGWLQEWWCGWGLGGGARDWVRGGGAASMGGMCPQLSPLERYTGSGPHLLTPGEGWLYKISDHTWGKHFKECSWMFPLNTSDHRRLDWIIFIDSKTSVNVFRCASIS